VWLRPASDTPCLSVHSLRECCPWHDFQDGVFFDPDTPPKVQEEMIDRTRSYMVQLATDLQNNTQYLGPGVLIELALECKKQNRKDYDIIVFDKWLQLGGFAFYTKQRGVAILEAYVVNRRILELPERLGSITLVKLMLQCVDEQIYVLAGVLFHENIKSFRALWTAMKWAGWETGIVYPVYTGRKPQVVDKGYRKVVLHYTRATLKKDKPGNVAHDDLKIQNLDDILLVEHIKYR
jgi:hypothetical protein